VRKFLDVCEGQIVVEYLPPYAPELNPVEYLWGLLETSPTAQCVRKISGNSAMALVARCAACVGVLA
jgi:transposase